MTKQRVDLALVERGLAPSRARAQALVLAGKVFTRDRRIEKASDMILAQEPIEVKGEDHPYVSRGGVKLAGALDAFQFDPSGMKCADFGASTGGFTDCLLQRGASLVYAIDVGWGQLDWKLRSDARVIVRERENARFLDEEKLGERVDLIVIDASFIGLEKLLPAAKAVLKPNGHIIALVKPQFEVGRDRVSKGGVVRDEEARLDSIENVSKVAAELGLSERGRKDAVITGPKGNQEAFLWFVQT